MLCGVFVVVVLVLVSTCNSYSEVQSFETAIGKEKNSAITSQELSCAVLFSFSTTHTKKAYILTKSVEEIIWRGYKFRKMYHISRRKKNDVTEKARGLGRKTRCVS